ncbi:general stress protein [Enterococcus sp. AZ007]|uniref:Stress response regulator gls24 homolog n=2 Tax=Enterococcus TaxID=1350 RepID=A0ABS3HJC8_9ENTE|nr:Asp23/Gls24 family envelope stress response protein [Enterococcus sp. MJM16]
MENNKNTNQTHTPVTHAEPVIPPNAEQNARTHSNDGAKPTHNGFDQANESGASMKGEVTYDDKVIQKIIGIALENVDGLLTVDGGFFSNAAEKLVNTDNVTAGIETEVGKEQVAVDMEVVVEYGKDINDIFEQIKKIIAKEVQDMTHLDVIEVNVKVKDIKTKEEFAKDSETVQDKVTDAAKKTGDFASKQTDKAKTAVNNGADKLKENNEPRVD